MTSEVGSWPEEAAKLLAALQERARSVHPDVYAHLSDAVASVAAAVRLLAEGHTGGGVDGGESRAADPADADAAGDAPVEYIDIEIDGDDDDDLGVEDAGDAGAAP